MVVTSLCVFYALYCLFTLPPGSITAPDSAGYLAFTSIHTLGYPVFLKVLGAKGAIVAQPIRDFIDRAPQDVRPFEPLRFIQPIVILMGWLTGGGLSAFPRGRVQGEQAALAELGVADDKALGRDVLEPQRERIGDPEPR